MHKDLCFSPVLSLSTGAAFFHRNFLLSYTVFLFFSPITNVSNKWRRAVRDCPFICINVLLKTQCVAYLRILGAIHAFLSYISHFCEKINLLRELDLLKELSSVLKHDHCKPISQYSRNLFIISRLFIVWNIKYIIELIRRVELTGCGYKNPSKKVGVLIHPLISHV